MAKTTLGPEAQNVANEATKLLKAQATSSSSEASKIKAAIKKMEATVEKNAGTDYDKILTNFLGHAVGDGTAVTRTAGSIEAVEKIVANPAASVLPLIEAIDETAVQTKCFGLSSIFSCFSSSDAS